MSQQTGGTDTKRLSGGVILTLVGVAVLLLFIFQNTNSVNFNFLWFAFSWPMWLYTIVIAVVGAIAWLGIGYLRRRRKD